MKLVVKGWEEGAFIPEKFAFGKSSTEGSFEVSDNISPEIIWSDFPKETKSFALICHDIDAPSDPTNVNKEGEIIPKTMPRVNFYHWVVYGIPEEFSSIDEGHGSIEVVPHGKDTGPQSYGISGANDFSKWFLEVEHMRGLYGEYDGPCPPLNDEKVHRYIFTVYALDIGDFDHLEEPVLGDDVLKAIDGHILDSATYSGLYTMNPDLKSQV